MNQEIEESQQKEESDFSTLLERFESEFDWNLIGIVSIWLFLLATFFLIFQSA